MTAICGSILLILLIVSLVHASGSSETSKVSYPIIKFPKELFPVPVSPIRRILNIFSLI
jgi:hypothetical protein